MSKYSVHEAMSQIDIALVMEHRERIGRKFDANEIGHTFKDIAERFVQGYRGDFPFMLTLQQKLEQYGRLFASQSAGALNCLVAEVEHELKQAVRQEKYEQKKSTGKRKTISIGFKTHEQEVETFERPTDIQARRRKDPALYAAEMNAWVVYHGDEHVPAPNRFSDAELLRRFGDDGETKDQPWHVTSEQVRQRAGYYQFEGEK